MLPERLSCDLCSLRPDEDRLAFTVDIELDAQGRVRHYDPYPSVIRSRVRMDYDGAEALLVHVPARWSMGCWKAPLRMLRLLRPRARRRLSAVLRARKRAANVDLGDFLVAANELAELRRRIRRARGSVDFDTAEIRALLDEDGVPVQIVARERSCATSLIEEAMLLANECVAEWLADRDIEPAIACMRIRAPIAARCRRCAGAAGHHRRSPCCRSIALGSPDELQAAVDAAAGTANAPLIQHAASAQHAARTVQAAQRGPLCARLHRAITLRVPSVATTIWWCTACSNCSWPMSSSAARTPWSVRRGLDRQGARVAAAHSAADLPRMQRCTERAAN